MTGAVAALPMYDWPEVRAHTDALWAALRARFRAGGIAAPETLRREGDLMRIWTDPRLTLAQTCGLPFVRRLAGRVTLLGAPDFGVPDCPPGYYDSAVVVRGDDPRETLAAFRGAHLALNATDSQSGCAAILHHAAPLARGARFFGAATVTGSHEASAALVAAGGADLAAIDHVSWRLMRRLRPATAGLRVLMRTDPTPGLPYVAALGVDAAGHRAAIAEALATLPAETRDALDLRGFRAFDPQDYAVIAERAAHARVALPPA